MGLLHDMDSCVKPASSGGKISRPWSYFHFSNRSGIVIFTFKIPLVSAGRCGGVADFIGTNSETPAVHGRPAGGGVLQIVVLNGVLSEAEQDAYIRRVTAKYPMSVIEKLILDVQAPGSPGYPGSFPPNPDRGGCPCRRSPSPAPDTPPRRAPGSGTRGGTGRPGCPPPTSWPPDTTPRGA